MDSSKSVSRLTQLIKQEAHSLGFTHVGITQARPLEPEGDRLQAWLDSDYHATMTWMKNRAAERKDIRKYFPGARSVVSLAMNYFHGHSGGKLKVSNYAWGDDYHRVVKDRIIELLSAIQKVRPHIQALACVDTSGVMEKVWAQRAGLGWLGKHTNLITRDSGSWVFLGELILEVELDYDPPFEENLCGTCTACLEACPTGAIVDEYVLNANRCISYLTIEHRGDFPAGMAEHLHGWIYGCDICQEVCPWNIKFAKTSGQLCFEPRREIINRTVDEWLNITEEEYGRTFRNSAMKRAKFFSLKRNILANLN